MGETYALRCCIRPLGVSGDNADSLVLRVSMGRFSVLTGISIRKQN